MFGNSSMEKYGRSGRRMAFTFGQAIRSLWAVLCGAHGLCLRNRGSMLAMCLLMCVAANAFGTEFPTEKENSPVNQVFQFSETQTCSDWSDGSKNSATAYLWIPENCNLVKGLLILCSNVPEHRLVGDPELRKVCAERQLAIVWCTPSFMNWAAAKPGQKKMSGEYETTARFLENLLAGLAKRSGYEEVATVPWLPIGESGHLLMVDALVEARPERCIAGIWLKNNHLPPHNRETPALVIYGTAQEWGQDKADLRVLWRNVDAGYAQVLRERERRPKWPLSYVIDGWSGHFDCSEQLTSLVCRYIDGAARARLPEGSQQPLRTVALEQGFVADLPVPGHEGRPVAPAKEGDALPWYFDRESAVTAQAIANINWHADSQLPGLLNDTGEPLAFDFNGILNPKRPSFEPDGITFQLHPAMLDVIPTGFIGAGERLAKTSGEPEIEWLCGNAISLGNNRFRIALTRAGGPIYLALRKGGTNQVRGVVQPVHLELTAFRNSDGQPQKISFDTIPDVKASDRSIPVHAVSSSGLPVQFYVETGPAIVKDSKLLFTPIPPRARYPIEVTVVAWQWGTENPKVQTADQIKQKFQILRD